MKSQPLVTFTDRGFYVPLADVYIDPIAPVSKAFITHGHADHSSYGHQSYLCTHSALPVIKYRMGSHTNISGVSFGESITVNGVQFSFYPAGHIIGSAQIKIEYKGEIWVVSGDYKLTKDKLSENFESVKCHTFITESTFGLPEFSWQSDEVIFDSINLWWRNNIAQDRVSIIAAYALGKAQRIINGVDHSIGKVFTHGSIENINEVIRRQGILLANTTRVTQKQKSKIYKGALVIAPPPIALSSWTFRFQKQSVAIASGWIGKNIKDTRFDKEFELSDHADYNQLLDAVQSTNAEKVFVNHGYTKEFCKSLINLGIDAEEVFVT
ncbi:MAG: ligase-associated DNA damage response exonuclease [Saprospiraceae bacterium]